MFTIIGTYKEFCNYYIVNIAILHTNLIKLMSHSTNKSHKIT
jgi:hypothetical protein